jgi:prephenate dehydrogenase
MEMRPRVAAIRQHGNTGRRMKIAIMGSGGIGGYYGAQLQAAGTDVTFVARGAHLEAMRQNGLTVEGDKPVQLPKVKATDDPSSIGKVDMVIFAVKLRDTEAAARAILPVLGPTCWRRSSGARRCSAARPMWASRSRGRA